VAAGLALRLVQSEHHLGDPVGSTGTTPDDHAAFPGHKPPIARLNEQDDLLGYS
jgi:hypothetical protein